MADPRDHDAAIWVITMAGIRTKALRRQAALSRESLERQPTLSLRVEEAARFVLGPLTSMSHDGVHIARARSRRQDRSPYGYVASVVLGQRVAVLGANVARVYLRLFGLPALRVRITDAKHRWRLAERMLAQKEARDFNWAILDLGGTV